VASMDYEDLIATVGDRAHLARDDAERAVAATLQTLAERLSKGALDQGLNRHLADQLPLELSPWLLTDAPPETFDADEFLRRVAAREGVDVHRAARDVRAVLAVLREAVSQRTFSELLADLPHDFRPLLLNLVVPSVDEIVDDVARRSGRARDHAFRATQAVLETLAERIPAGEVDDLVARLPIELHDVLKRGRDTTVALSADEFVRRVAEREHVTEDEARRDTRAVFAALREVVDLEEFSDVAVALSKDFDALLETP
jgi:uncharacterized protein (DUF2267 family)